MSAIDELDAALKQTNRYRICKSQRGFTLWRFYAWDQTPCGWQILVPDLKTREDAAIHLAKRLGLTDDEPPEPLPPQTALITWTDTEWL